MENLTEIGQEKMKNLQIGLGTMSLLGGLIKQKVVFGEE